MARGKRTAAMEPVDAPWELPEGWRWERLGDLVGKSSKKHIASPQSRLDFIGLEHIPPQSMQVTGSSPFASMRSSASAFEEGDLLYSRLRPYLNKLWVADRAGACSGELLVLRPLESIEARYLAYCMHSERFVSYASHAVAGDRPRIDFSQVEAFMVPFPPIKDQRRIVARIDALFAEIEEGEQALAEARAGVETYRKSLLKAAVTGELTADWRQNNDGGGQELLDHLRSMKRISKRNRVPIELGRPAVEETPLILPDTWCWARLDDLIVEGPSNGYSPRASLDGTGTKALKLTATSSGKMRLDADCFKIIGEVIDIESKLYLRTGDLLFQRGNTRELVGIAAIYDGPPTTYIYPDLMIRIRTADPILDRWLWRWSNSPHGRSHMMAKAQGAAGSMPKISGETLREMPVPLGPIKELELALTRLDGSFEGIDDYEQAMGILKSASIWQSVLASAFRGELQ